MSDLKEYEDKMKKSHEALREELTAIRAGRANPHILDKLTVLYYGAPTPLPQVANVSVPEARMLQIQPWDSSLIKEIMKAIQTSDIGITPGTDGKVIRLVYPELTEDRRKELAKEVKKKGEDAKVAIRNIRRDANDSFKKENKAGSISDDELSNMEDSIQKLTDEYTKKIDDTVKNKMTEVMTL
ncbi:MAG: ribosome recycling factor [Lachnospiraceae bacterium]|jgi:ribosome recycling factor|nr:ribosome recycling factor [Lachnospiraceae bacterium]MCH4030656.1 ribosome recycling factor [Lachnospiraceae bacterium]MCH4069865.1 ribosome recycling factor [Lachnospiraceae bacterium]MCH4107196.1 ribosome recycling factor [Lachnospiraceae bacterium]MCI1301949.1 ribosome recycling factor [Lachnospiraceae bacterium]